MNRIILQKALSELLKRKKHAEQIAEANYEKALEIADYKKLDSEERVLKVEISKLEFYDKDSSVKVARLKQVKKEKQTLLEENFGKDFSIKPNYSCKQCSDSGFFNNMPCSCLKQEISSILLDLSGTCKNLSSFEDVDFKIFEPEHRKTIEEAYDKMKLWCEKVSTTPYRNIGFFGKTGVGKTFLSEAMANKLIKDGHVVVATTAFAMNQTFLTYHTSPIKDKDVMLSEYLDCEVLFIDDLGSEPILKNVTLEYLYLVINERNLKNKATVYTTNLSIEEFRNRYDERISSRLFNKRNSILINFDFSDLRLKK